MNAETSFCAEIVSAWKTPPVKVSGVIITSFALGSEEPPFSPKQPANGAKHISDTNSKARMCEVPSMELRQLPPSQVCAYFVSSITV